MTVGVGPDPSPAVPELVTLAGAKQHLRIRDSDHDAEVDAKRAAATAIVFYYLKKQGDPAWTVDTVPGDVREAILVLLGFLYQERGDGSTQTTAAENWHTVERLLVGRRDPALA